MMDEPSYLKRCDQVFRTIQDAFDKVDPDDAESFMAGDVLTIAFKNGVRCVVNTQRPTRQIWLAARARAWHFDYDPAQDRWVDDKGRGDELMACLRQIARENAGVEVAL